MSFVVNAHPLTLRLITDMPAQYLRILIINNIIPRETSSRVIRPLLEVVVKKSPLARANSLNKEAKSAADHRSSADVFDSPLESSIFERHALVGAILIHHGLQHQHLRILCIHL